MPIPSKSAPKGASAKFPKAKGGSGVRVSPGKGGVQTGTPTGCVSKRAHANVKTGY